MSAYLSLWPVQQAVYTRLFAPSMTALGVTGVFDDVKQDTPLPYVEFEVREAIQFGGFGTQHGNRQLPFVEVRVHAYDGGTGRKRLHSIIAKAIELMVTAPLTVTGYTVHSAGTPIVEEIVPLMDEPQGGINVKEEVVTFGYWMEQG